MSRRRLTVTAALLLALAPIPAWAADTGDALRVATFNASLNRAAEGELVADLSTPDDPQAREVAEVIQRTRPDVLLINEFDYAPDAVDLFRDNYLEVPQNGAEPIDYPYAFIAPSNTGVPSGLDLDDNGTVGGGNDALGFGLFPGQYGMLVLSRHPIGEPRTFQDFLWKDLPDSRIPTSFYSPEEQAVLPLSSKSHWDVPVDVDGTTVHVLASHPTPPTFDGPEDRNGLRNADEIAFWRHYLSDSEAIYDDEGVHGGLDPAECWFVVLGDMNSDPLDGDSLPGAAAQLLDAPPVLDSAPSSEGAAEAAVLQGGPNLTHRGDPALDTADFSEPVPGNLRVDYALPSNTFQLVDSGVFWPTAADPLARLNDASDHHLTWVDVHVS